MSQYQQPAGARILAMEDHPLLAAHLGRRGLDVAVQQRAAHNCPGCLATVWGKGYVLTRAPA